MENIRREQKRADYQREVKQRDDNIMRMVRDRKHTDNETLSRTKSADFNSTTPVALAP